VGPRSEKIVELYPQDQNEMPNDRVLFNFFQLSILAHTRGAPKV